MSRALSALIVTIICSAAMAQSVTSPLEPFTPDEHTLLLYHFDEGEGELARDAGPHGYHGAVQGAAWSEGRFGGALRFDGVDDSVFRKDTPAMQKLPVVTVECWFSPDDPSGRQFLMGQDVGFHFDVSSGAAMSLSIYNQGGGVQNADGLPHQHLGTGIPHVRPRRWHHHAATYDGQYISFFSDGVLRARREAARDFLLGVPARGFWVGSYVDTDFYFSGRIDEVRISDCVRYDPERTMNEGERLFDVPEPPKLSKSLREPQKTGLARVQCTLKKLYGSDAAGQVYLKAPGQEAAIVGSYELKGLDDGTDAEFSFDVSDEVTGEGCYILGLEPQDTGAYFTVTDARLLRGDEKIASWSGEARSRRTFQPPVLVPLQVGAATAAEPAEGYLLRPTAIDRLWGNLGLDAADAAGAPILWGEGYAEFWLDVPVGGAYDVLLRYGGGLRPCDIVIDGKDVHPYHMAAREKALGGAPQDHLWERQSTVLLEPGLHWVRLQDHIPDTSGLWLRPAESPVPYALPRERFEVPDEALLSRAEAWTARTLLGKVDDARLHLYMPVLGMSLSYSATFAGGGDDPLRSTDRVRFSHPCRVDLEPFGRLTFSFQGTGSGHVLALRLVDVKGDEMLLWRERDTEEGLREVEVPISFEGNHVFSPGHVVAVCVDLDSGNAGPGQMEGGILNPRLWRRDAIATPEGYAEQAGEAREQYAALALPPAAEPLRARGFKFGLRPVVPETHPLFSSTDPRPVTRETLGDDLHFTGSRSISAASLDDFHSHYDFGDICWPNIGTLPLREKYDSDEAYAEALADLEQKLEAVKARGLIVWDIWGYVPDHPDFPWRVAPEHVEILKRVLGDRFLGFDNGEQDGRYIGAYADRGTFTDRKGGWEDFVRWDERICADNGNYMNATGSLNFSHYYADRAHRTLGLETAQGLPSDTLMFSFLRGAARQYGRLTTQATSIWNRYGYNLYNDRKTMGGNGYGFGPNKGCSLSLHKRLLLQSYTGGDSIAGTETGQFTSDRLENGAPELSPLGEQHLAVRDWVRAHPDRGVMQTPVAFMLDFYNGWNMPRHLYRGDKYKIWGKLPYEKGDYLTDAMFRMVWPGYEDCSYLRNERGFITDTPYGDSFDVLTNRCHPDILQQYSALMLLGDVEITPQVAQTLEGFVRAGGDLILDAKQAQAFASEFTGVRVGESASGRTSRRLPDGEITDELPYTYSRLEPAGARALLGNENGDTLMTVMAVGEGRVIVGAADYWMTDKLEYQVPEIVNMEPPYLLLQGVRAVLDDYFASHCPVQVTPFDLNVRTCSFENDPKRLLIGLTNNNLFADWEGELAVKAGPIESAVETWSGRELGGGESVKLTLAAGDVALVDVRLR